MTRFARMPKKKHLDPTSWEEFAKQRKVEQNETLSDDPQTKEQKSIPENKENNSKSKKRSNEKEDMEKAVVSSPRKKKKKNDIASLTESQSIIKKDKKKGKKSHSKDAEQKTKQAIASDDAKVYEKQLPIKTKSFRSHREEKLEKQREARRRRRAKSKGLACFHCRELGHLAAHCPQISQDGTGVGVCYKCGSSDHTTKNCKEETKKADNPFPFAKCFICGETGHLSRGCPDNPKGLYPKGGGCNVCGSVEHLKRDCPEMIKSRQKDGNFKSKGVKFNSSKRSKYTSADAEVESDEEKPLPHKPYFRKKKVVKF